MSRCCSNEPKRLISASVGCAIPVDKKAYGYISEHHAFGYTERQTGDYAEDLAAAMLASTLGIDFDVDESWDEKKELFKISGKIVGTRNTTQSCVLKTGDYTTVLAAAVLFLKQQFKGGNTYEWCKSQRKRKWRRAGNGWRPWS